MLRVEAAVHEDGAADLQDHGVLRKEAPGEGATRLDGAGAGKGLACGAGVERHVSGRDDGCTGRGCRD